MTDPTWTVDEDGTLMFGGHHNLLSIAEGSCRSYPGALAAYAALVRCVRDAGLLPAALDVTARLLAGWKVTDHPTVRYGQPYWWHPTDGMESMTDAQRAWLDLVKDRQP